jgi:hypothetical protein
MLVRFTIQNSALLIKETENKSMGNQKSAGGQMLCLVLQCQALALQLHENNAPSMIANKRLHRG